MVASKEWTEWHLTPQGWQRGSEREDFTGTQQKSPPNNRVLSVLYKEVLPSAFSVLKKSCEEVWSTDDIDLIKQLKAQFGECPDHL